LRDPKKITAVIAHQQADVEARQQERVHENQLLEKALARSNHDLKRWEDAYLNEVLILEEFKAKKAEVDARRECLHAEQARLDEQARCQAQEYINIHALEDFCHDLATALTHVDMTKKQHALEMLKIVVTLEPGRARIDGLLPVHTEYMSFQ
jgi:hypothetical protein